MRISIIYITGGNKVKMYFEKMNEVYKEKNYPKDSVFEKFTSANKKGSVILIVMLILLAIPLAIGILWSISRINDMTTQGDTELLNTGFVILAIMVVLFLLCILCIVLSVKNFHKDIASIVIKAAKKSGLTEEDIWEFNRQAMQSDSYILKFKNKIAAALANQQDGILTRDYLWMGIGTNFIIKRSDIVGVCFLNSSFYVNNKKVWTRNISVLTHKNQSSSAEATEESGLAFMELLLSTQPDIKLEKKLLTEGKEYDDWCLSLCEKTH